jgi:hypothetical protein
MATPIVGRPARREWRPFRNVGRACRPDAAPGAPIAHWHAMSARGGRREKAALRDSLSANEDNGLLSARGCQRPYMVRDPSVEGRRLFERRAVGRPLEPSEALLGCRNAVQKSLGESAVGPVVIAT